MGEIFNEIRQLVDALERADRELAQANNLNLVDSQALGLLNNLGPMQPKDLAAHMGYTTGGITTVIDRLVEKGHAVRGPHPFDKRKVVVRSLHRQKWDVEDALEKDLAGLMDADLRLVREALSSLADLIRLATSKIV